MKIVNEDKMLVRGKGSFLINSKAFLKKLFKIVTSAAVIIAVLYLAILTSVFLLGIFLAIFIISFVILQFKKKKNYFK